jgi:hypothetical protein
MASAVVRARPSSSRIVWTTGSPTGTGLAGAGAVHDDAEALEVEAAHGADEAGPRDGRVRDAALLAHEEDGLSGRRRWGRPRSRSCARGRVAARGRAVGEGEARAPEERRVLEGEHDVVERLEEHEAVVRGHEALVRIGREPEGLRRDLAPPLVGHAAIDRAELQAAHVDDEPAEGRHRDEVSRTGGRACPRSRPSRGGGGASARSRSPRACRARPTSRILPRCSGVALPERAEVAGLAHLARGGRDRGRVDAGAEADADVEADRPEHEHTERDELLLVVAEDAREALHEASARCALSAW